MKEIVERIEAGLAAAAAALEKYTPGEIESRRKRGGDPVTEADLEVNSVLHSLLPRPGEGWLSEETADDPGRLERERVWIVDPIDGTREFVEGLPEWSISIGYVVDGRAVAGGIFNPAADHRILGSLATGVTFNGEPVRPRAPAGRDQALVLASRSEVRRGEWRRYARRGFEIRPLGSVAYKLGLVAGGRADATWTLVPKHEWDVAAGVALITAAGGAVFEPDETGNGGAGDALTFNRPRPKFRALVALAAGATDLWHGERFVPLASS